jgi:hypothetical protein
MNQQEIAQELRRVAALARDLQNAIFQLATQINRPEAAAVSAASAAASQQTPLVSGRETKPGQHIVQLTPPPRDGVLDRSGATTQPNPRELNAQLQAAALVPQEVIAAVKTSAENTVVHPTAVQQEEAQDALGSAKIILDQVKSEDLEKVRQAADQGASNELVIVKPTQPAPQKEVENNQALLACFIGPGSLFTHYLSEEAVFKGKGELKPGVANMKRHTNDARWIDENSLRHWPTGFYTDRDTKMMQFLVNTDQAAILVDSLPSEHSPVHVRVYGANEGFKPIQSFEASELRLLHAKFNDALEAIVKKKQ